MNFFLLTVNVRRVKRVDLNGIRDFIITKVGVVERIVIVTTRWKH